MGRDASSFPCAVDERSEVSSRPGPGGGAASAEWASRERLLDRIVAIIGEIDRRIHDQIEAVIHHPRFQALEASWRGLQHLVSQVQPGDNVLIRVLNARWSELRRDFQAATEFDDSALFRLLYDGELTMPGGRPLGVLLGDYQVCHKVSGHGVSGEGDLHTLEHLASLGSACFMPFVTSAHPSLLELESFRELELPLRIAEDFRGQQYISWRAFRRREEARFVCVLLPRVLMRRPYEDGGVAAPAPSFRERWNAPDASDLLWGSPVYAFGAVLIRSFRETGLFFDICGMRLADPVPHAGLVGDLPVIYCGLDADRAWPLPQVEVSIPDRLERELASAGLVSLCSLPYSGGVVFHSDSSMFDPYQESVMLSPDARLGSRARYILSVSRLAHCLYVMARSMIGSFTDEREIQDRLNDWLVNYTSVTDRPDAATRARFPFRQAEVDVSESTRIGRYLCRIKLTPHPEIDSVSGVLELSTQLRGPNQ